MQQFVIIADHPPKDVDAHDGYPEGFDKSIGLPASAMRAANALLTSLNGNREWDVPATAEALLAYATANATLHPVTSMTFPQAMFYLRQGLRVFRHGWSENTWVQALRLEQLKTLNMLQDQSTLVDGTPLTTPFMKTANNDLIPWTPNAVDMAYSDWSLCIEDMTGLVPHEVYLQLSPGNVEVRLYVPDYGKQHVTIGTNLEELASYVEQIICERLDSPYQQLQTPRSRDTLAKRMQGWGAPGDSWSPGCGWRTVLVDVDRLRRHMNQPAESAP